MVEIPISRYRFHFKAIDSVRFGPFAGSAWRGAFGVALKRTVCAVRLRSCDECPLVASCAFPYLFEGRRSENAVGLGSYAQVPVPYVFQPTPHPGLVLARGDPLAVDLGLVGKANQRLLYLIHALDQAGAHGVGIGRGRLFLEAVDRLATMDGEIEESVLSDGEFQPPGDPVTPSATLDDAAEIVIDIRTPVRLKLNGHLVTPERFSPSALVDAAVRRVSALAAFHAGAPIEADYRELKRLAGQLTLRDAELRWEDWKRYSSRQSQEMKLGGIVGRCAVSVPTEAGDVLRWLDLAQWVGVGKGASMGLGQIRVAVAKDGAG